MLHRLACCSILADPELLSENGDLTAQNNTGSWGNITHKQQNRKLTRNLSCRIKKDFAPLAA